MTKDLEVPAYRERIIRELSAIASGVWIPRVLAGPKSGGSWVHLEEIILLLFDSLDFDCRPQESIGVAFYDAAEVQAVLAFAQLFDTLLNEINEDNDYAMVTDPRWPEVRARAQAALEVLKQRG